MDLPDADHLIVTYTIAIDKDGNIYNDVQSHNSSFAEVYKAFISIQEEVNRQITERRVCPYNPKYGNEPRA
jgi:hypothetical protein